MDVFSAEHFRDDKAARKMLESLLWPDGPICCHCGTINHAYATKREGVFRCAEKECRKDFTVTMRTVMERSKIALHKWLQAFALMTASKKGISAHQLHRTLDIGYEAAWFMSHRIREAMRNGGLASPMGEGGGAVEVDETYIGRVKGAKIKQGSRYHKRTVLSLVDRKTKQVRSFHVAHATASEIAPIVRANISQEAALMTDEARWYETVGREFDSHDTVNHRDEEYVRVEGERIITTNTVENYFSVFKRGMRGVYQHCAEKHLHRYLAEYDFRYNHRVKLGYNDGERAALAVKGAAGKRLTYQGRH
jgi:transposase-like protein